MICAFNVNNMEIVQAVTRAAKEVGVPVILQASAGAVKYAGVGYIRALVEAARAETGVDITLHLDHGATFEDCKAAIDNGFNSVMIDASHLPFEQNVSLTKKVVDYARGGLGGNAPKRNVLVEGELGEIQGIEDEKQSENSHYTDPTQAAEFIKRTGVDSLAVSIGTAHGAFKYAAAPEFRFDILEKIHALCPNTPLVLHGASSVTPADVATINANGGKIENARGVSEEILARAGKFGVKKINIDSDLRLAFTAAVREYLAKNPTHFDPRTYLAAAREHVKEIVKKKLEIYSRS